MYPLVHIYAVKKMLKRRDPLLFYGSVFPDIAATGVIGWDEVLKKTEGFSNYIVGKDVGLDAFAEGLLLHEKPVGIDRFVHGENKDGYAFLKGRIILGEVEKLFLKDSLGVAHSFVEFACDLLIASRKPDLSDDLALVLSVLGSVVDEISALFASYFSQDLKDVLLSVDEFNGFLRRFNLVFGDGALGFYADLTNRLRGTSYRQEEIGRIVDLALGVVSNDFFDFIDEVIDRCRSDYLEYKRAETR
jgi:hypothetical protein